MHDIKPIPVIYGNINKYDPDNYIYLSKTFSSNPGGAHLNARKKDSIFFSGVKVSALVAKLRSNSNDVIPSSQQRVDLQYEVQTDKKEGIFHYPDSPVFTLHFDLRNYDVIWITISIPGYDDVTIKTHLIGKPILVEPRPYGGKITTMPEYPYVAFWMGGNYGDIRYFFEIYSFAEDRIYVDTLSYPWLGITSFEGKFYHHFKYEHLQMTLIQGLPEYPDLKYRKFGDVIIEISHSNDYFTKTIPGELSPVNNDYISTELVDRPEYLGRISSYSMERVDSIEVTEITRYYVHDDPELSFLKMSKWELRP